MAPPKVKAGTVIAGRYRLVAPLSRGGMGSVWRAEHLSLGSPIAVKLIDADLVEHDEPRARFEQEARAAAALRSPNVVQILDHGVDKELPFIVMELLDGESLAARLHRLGSIPAAHLVRIFQDVARAIKKAHDLGIVHRDLKPDNIFLVKNEDQEIAKILDFGIAKAQNPLGEWKGGTRTGALIGTPQYMSPEQAQGLSVDKSCDLWALGVIAFECLCGRLPFPSEKPGELILQICVRPIPVPSQVARVTPRFDVWFARACQRDPAARFTSARELADTLAEVLGLSQALTDASGSFPAIPAVPSLIGPLAPAAAAPAVASLPVAAPLVQVSSDRESMPGPFGPGGTQVGGMEPPLAALLPPGALQGAAPSPPAQREARLSGTMSGGAVMDSDPATLVVVPTSRTRQMVLAVALSAIALGAIVMGLALSSDPTGLPSGPDTATQPQPSVEPRLTASAVVTATPPEATTSPSAVTSATPSSAPSTTRGGWHPLPIGPKASTAPRASASGAPSASPSGTKTKERIGF
jgi:eukaryotic-like serine/threonine-protein kinase